VIKIDCRIVGPKLIPYLFPAGDTAREFNEHSQDSECLFWQENSLALVLRVGGKQFSATGIKLKCAKPHSD
jgi:hypothetical protein